MIIARKDRNYSAFGQVFAEFFGQVAEKWYLAWTSQAAIGRSAMPLRLSKNAKITFL